MVLDLFGSAVKLQRIRPATPTGNFRRRSGYDAEDFRKLQTESGAAMRSPTETQKLGSRLGTDFSGGVTASTGTVAARRHAGVHAPLIV